MPDNQINPEVNNRGVGDLNEEKLFKRQYLYYPILIAVITGLIGLISNEVIRRQQIRASKIEIISDLTKNFADYYYNSGVRSMIHFEKSELASYYADTSILGLSRIELPIGKRLELQDSLEKKYPTAYKLMIEGDSKVSNLSKSLILTQLYFSGKVKVIADSLQNYIPIDNAIDRKTSERQKSNKSRISESEKNTILIEVFKEMGTLYNDLLNKMNDEK